jgi:hypothetical protein
MKLDLDLRIDAREHGRDDVHAERDDRHARNHIRSDLAALTTDGDLARHVATAEVFIECEIDETADRRDGGETTEDNITHRCSPIYSITRTFRSMKVPTRSACVIAGATPEAVRAVGTSEHIELTKNRLGTLVTGRPGDLVIDFAAELPGPVYDVMYNAGTGWFAVTIYRGETRPVRWDNRPGEDAGYPRVTDILGATSPETILAVLDIPADALAYGAGSSAPTV